MHNNSDLKATLYMAAFTIVFGVAGVLAGLKAAKDFGEMNPDGAYTVWIGSTALAGGYETDAYSVQDGMVVFVNKKTGREMAVPAGRVLKINTN